MIVIRSMSTGEKVLAGVAAMALAFVVLVAVACSSSSPPSASETQAQPPNLDPTRRTPIPTLSPRQQAERAKSQLATVEASLPTATPRVVIAYPTPLPTLPPVLLPTEPVLVQSTIPRPATLPTVPPPPVLPTPTHTAPLQTPSSPEPAALVPMRAGAANDSTLFLEELSVPERVCVEGVYETISQHTLQEFSFDLNDCLEDETHLRRISHPFGITAFGAESSACIREETRALDLNRVMVAGPPMTVDLLLAGLVVQFCMTDDELKQVAGEWADVERGMLNCLFRDGVDVMVQRLRPHQGNDDRLIDAYNRVVDTCQ